MIGMETLRIGSKGENVKILQRALHLIDDGVFGKLTHEAVKEAQRRLGLVADGVVGVKTWNAIMSSSGAQPIVGLKKSTRTITDIIVHCTATIEGKNKTVAEIRKQHKAQGWSDIGYHYVIYLDGSIHEGRDVNLVGAHVNGHNAHSIGVVYVGGLDKNKKAKDTRTPKQKEALLKLLKELKVKYPMAKIKGHRDYSPDKNGDGIISPCEWIKQCPCFDAQKEYSKL